VYYGSRNAAKIKATDLACDQVLLHDLGRYGQEDMKAVQKAKDNRDYGKLWSALVECGAIREGRVND
jgi:hypothetical protein